MLEITHVLGLTLHRSIITKICNEKKSDSFTTSEFKQAHSEFYKGRNEELIHFGSIEGILKAFNVVQEVEPGIWGLRY